MQQVMLRSGQPLKIWDQLEIIVGEGEQAGKYRARIEDFINGGIVITSPEYVEGNTLLRQDIDVTVNICRDDAVYQFSSQIRQRTSTHRRYLILTPPRNVRRVQRRLFVRIEAIERLEYAAINPTLEWQDYEDRATWHPSKTVDISGGGLLMKVGDDVSVKDLIFLKIGFFADLSLPDVVVGVCRRIFSRGRARLAGIEIVLASRMEKYFRRDEMRRLPRAVLEFDGKAQDRLVNYVFNKQIEMRNKGVL